MENTDLSKIFKAILNESDFITKFPKPINLKPVTMSPNTPTQHHIVTLFSVKAWRQLCVLFISWSASARLMRDGVLF